MMPGAGPAYRSPMEEAYNYFANRNLLDPALMSGGVGMYIVLEMAFCPKIVGWVPEN